MSNSAKLAKMAARDAQMIDSAMRDESLYRIKEEHESPTGMAAAAPFVLYKGYTKLGSYKTRADAEAAMKRHG